MTQGDYVITRWTLGEDENKKQWKFCRLIAPLPDGNISETTCRVEPDTGETLMLSELEKCTQDMINYHKNYASTIEQKSNPESSSEGNQDSNGGVSSGNV